MITPYNQIWLLNLHSEVFYLFIHFLIFKYHVVSAPLIIFFGNTPKIQTNSRNGYAQVFF